MSTDITAPPGSVWALPDDEKWVRLHAVRRLDDGTWASMARNVDLRTMGGKRTVWIADPPTYAWLTGPAADRVVLWPIDGNLTIVARPQGAEK